MLEFYFSMMLVLGVFSLFLPPFIGAFANGFDGFKQGLVIAPIFAGAIVAIAAVPGFIGVLVGNCYNQYL